MYSQRCMSAGSVVVCSACDLISPAASPYLSPCTLAQPQGKTKGWGTVERFWQHNIHTSASSSASSCVPQPSKQLLNACPILPVHVIVTLLAGCQSAILSSNERHNDMNPAFISTIMFFFLIKWASS